MAGGTILGRLASGPRIERGAVRPRRGVAAVAGLILLTGCAGQVSVPATPSGMRPPAVIPAPPLPAISEPSEESKALSLYYRRLQNDLVARGLLRPDGGGPETPFTDTMLARNFEQIAFYDEYTVVAGQLRALRGPSALRRWDKPIRMSVEFGDTIPREQRMADTAAVAGYANRLARLTGLEITQTDAEPNYHVLFLNEDDRKGYEARLRALVPGIADNAVRAVIDLPRSQLCIVIAFADGDSTSYDKAVALIRGEHPDLLRLSCIHEEITQGLGLANDSPNARPSIFNDDEEFGLLTRHDELLLRILYDPRLRTGMTADEAAPIVRRIATELIDAERLARGGV